jgi:hypothetical protein
MEFKDLQLFFLGSLGFFPKTFSELELVVPFVPTHVQYCKLNLGIKILFYTFFIEPMKVFFSLWKTNGVLRWMMNRYPMGY